MGVLKQAHFAEKMRCAIILFICILASASSPTAADEHYNHIVPEEEYQEPNDVDFSVDDDILTESSLGSLAPCAGVMKSHAKAQQHENSVVPLFAGALAQQKEVCLAEEKANKRRQERRRQQKRRRRQTKQGRRQTKRRRQERQRQERKRQTKRRRHKRRRRRQR